MIKINDIVTIGNSKTIGKVLEIAIFGHKTKVKIDMGYKISSFNLKALHLTLEKTELDLPKTRQELKEKRSIEKIIESKPLYRTSFRKFCYKKAFIKGL